MAALAGKSGSVLLDGTARPFADWALAVRQERLDCSDTGRKAARHRLGTPVAEITVGGFYPGGLGLKPGAEVRVILDCGDDVSFGPFWCLFEGPAVATTVKGAARMDWRFLVNDDFLDGESPLEF